MNKKIQKQYDDDDGRVIADMNIEGMPWYVSEKRKKGGDGQTELSKSESRAFLSGVVGASLLIAGVFAGGFTLFILLCTQIWFK